jgi:hypothetical protein
MLFGLRKMKEIVAYPTSGIFFQDFGNMTHTHRIGNFSGVLLKIGEKKHD